MTRAAHRGCASVRSGKPPVTGLAIAVNQAGFLSNGLTASHEGKPNFLRRSESEPLPKSGRLISFSSDTSRTSPRF
jgi:hypothetical protein